MAAGTDGEISDVQALLELVKKIVAGQPRHAHLRWWFRGQSDCQWPLHPAVYRSGFPAKSEDGRLKTEQHLTQDFRVESAGLRSGNDQDAEVYFLQQHYGMPTRLLDWTTSPLAALFFAVSENVEQDGAFYAMDAYQLAHNQDLGGVSFAGIATSRHGVFKRALQPIFQWKTVADFPEFTFPVRPDHFDYRVGAQKSCFTFHVPSCTFLTKTQNPTLRSLSIPKTAKDSLRDDLFRLGVDEFAIYGDLESLSKRLKYAHGFR